MQITLQHIADLCKVSRGTVSLALREDPRIKLKTRERIQKIAKDLDYEPNLLAASLRNKCSNSIWVILESLRSLYDCDVVRHLTAHFSNSKYDAMVGFHMEEANRYTRLTSKLFQGVADGAIIIPRRFGTDYGMLKKLALRDYPVVIVDVDVEGLGLPWVTSANDVSAAELINECRKKGCDRFILLSELPNSVAKQRNDGAVKEIESFGTWIHERDLSEKWLKVGKNKALAIFADSQAQILDFYKKWKEPLQGQALFFSCFDEWIGDAAPAKSVFVSVQDYEGIAREASQLLLEILKTGKNKAENQERIIKRVPRKELRMITSEFVR